MAKLKYIVPVLAIALELAMPKMSPAQNPPMNCAPDGIIEVCTLANTVAPSATAPSAASSTTAPSTTASGTPASSTTASSASEPSAPPPAAAPTATVSYRDGQLTISADNVPLRDVLQEVSHKTGAAIDIPAGSADEPVFVNIGPGPVRDVMAALLNGSRFNYVIAGLANDASGLKSIALTPAQQSTEAAPAAEQASITPPAYKAPNPPPAPAQADNQQLGFGIDAAELERQRQEVIQTAQREFDEEKKQGSPAPDPTN